MMSTLKVWGRFWIHHFLFIGQYRPTLFRLFGRDVRLSCRINCLIICILSYLWLGWREEDLYQIVVLRDIWSR